MLSDYSHTRCQQYDNHRLLHQIRTKETLRILNPIEVAQIAPKLNIVRLERSKLVVGVAASSTEKRKVRFGNLSHLIHHYHDHLRRPKSW